MLDRRRGRPSPRRAPFAEVQRLLRLYREQYGPATATPASMSGTSTSLPAILGHSPQARGRSERANRTLQDRLVNELRGAGIRTLAGANRYLRERFPPAYNATFGRAPADPTSAFVPLGAVDLDQILCQQVERVVGQDNVVTIDGQALQLPKQPGRRTCAGLRVLVRHHLNGQASVW